MDMPSPPSERPSAPAPSPDRGGVHVRPTARPPRGGHGERLPSTIPPSSVTPLEEGLLLPEQRFFDRLEDYARRAELLGALLQAKGMAPDRGVRALQAGLSAIVASADEANLPSLASLGRALRTAIGQLGLTSDADADARSLDLLVFDEIEVSRDLLALAVESQGHSVRCAATYEDFVRHVDERLPDLIITEIQFANAPAREFCSGLRELLASRPVPFVFFSSVAPGLLQELAASAGARVAISKDDGLAALVAALDGVVPTL